jgi:hypothetical protein
MALRVREKNRESSYKEEGIKSVIEGDIAKLNIAIPKQLHYKFKIKALQNNTNMSNLIVNWIKNYVNE